MYTHSDSHFEKDVTELVGFTNGYKPWEDIINAAIQTKCGMLGLICALNFFERIDKLYD